MITDTFAFLVPVIPELVLLVAKVDLGFAEDLDVFGEVVVGVDDHPVEGPDLVKAEHQVEVLRHRRLGVRPSGNSTAFPANPIEAPGNASARPKSVVQSFVLVVLIHT